MSFIASLPMYDWPEERVETDAQWARLRDLLRARGIDAPGHLARRNADLPPVGGGIRDATGAVIAPDPASLPPDELDFRILWRHPDLLLGQTCWGPMELGLQDHVQVVGQPDYSPFEGGQGELYSSAIVMRWGSMHKSPPDATAGKPEGGVQAPDDGKASIPLKLLTDQRLAFNSRDSMSGLIALTRDLEAMGSGLDIFSAHVETGAHRASVDAVAEGRADVCAVDCRSWGMIRRHQPEIAAGMAVVGWTGRRKGLPLIAARGVPSHVIPALREALAEAGMLAKR